MILTVTLNAAIDKTYTVPGFAAGGVWRAQEVRALPGGKGLNVTRVLHAMGIPVLATGFLAGHNGRWVEAALKEAGIAADFLWVEGETRLCHAFLDPEGQTTTEVLEPGPMLDERTLARFREHLASLLDGAEVVVFSESLPAGLPPDTYRVLVDDVKRAGKRAVVDTSGSAFAAALAARPDVVKPNRSELAAWWRRPCASKADVVEAVRYLQREAGGWAVVSLGDEGAVLASPRGLWYAPALPVPAVNTVGCGDAMVAGFTMALLEGWSEEEALRMATALAASNAEQPGAGMVDPSAVKRLARMVVASPVDSAFPNGKGEQR